MGIRTKLPIVVIRGAVTILDSRKGTIMGTDVDVYEHGSDAVSSAIQALAAGKQTVFSTIAGNDFETKLAVLQATTKSEPLADNLGKPIKLKDIVIQTIEMTDDATGETGPVPRVILVSDDGTAYHAISMGVFRAVENIIGILGMPSTWPAPLPVKVVREGKAPRAYFTIYPA